MDMKRIKAALEDGRKLPWWVAKQIRNEPMIMSLKLWAVRNRHNGEFAREANGEVAYFSSKMAAKTLRDKFGIDTWKVTKGPDHRLYKTDEEVRLLSNRPKKRVS